MKNFFKKLGKGQDTEQTDLNLDYGDFYSGKDSRADQDDRRDDRRDYDRFEEPRRDETPRDHSAGGYYDVPKPARGGYEEPDFRSDNSRYYDDRPIADRPAERVVERVVERPIERPVEQPVPQESYVKPRETWQEADAPAYRPAQPEAEAAPAPAQPAVFTPAPAPEYLYVTPSTYRDCREGIVKGLATGHVVVVRLRKLAANDVLRLFDYMMGAVLALDGTMERPAATTVVLVPKDVEINPEDLEADEDEEPYYEESEEEYDEEADDEADEEDYEEDYEEDTYANGEYGSYDEEDEYEDEEYDDEDYADDEYEDEEYDDEEYDEEYDEEEYDEEEYEDEDYADEESDEDEE